MEESLIIVITDSLLILISNELQILRVFLSAVSHAVPGQKGHVDRWEDHPGGLIYPGGEPEPSVRTWSILRTVFPAHIVSEVAHNHILWKNMLNA